MASPDAPPDSVARLLAHYAPEELDPERCEALLVGRLLEEGETTEIAWLLGRLGEARLAGWLEDRGRRQLSRRSRRFWELLLGCTAAPPTADREELWPL